MGLASDLILERLPLYELVHNPEFLTPRVCQKNQTKNPHTLWGRKVLETQDYHRLEVINAHWGDVDSWASKLLITRLGSFKLTMATTGVDRIKK
jgi:hypothetical protein